MELCKAVLVATVVIPGFYGSTTLVQATNHTDKTGVKWTPGIGSWTPLGNMSKDLPAYLTGYDYDGRPVFISEYGRWNTIKYLSEGNETWKDSLYRRAEKLWWNAVSGTYNTAEGEEGIVVILDVSGFSQLQLVNKDAIEFNLWNMRIGEACQDYVADFIIVNVNFLVNTWLELIRPVAGKLVGRATILSTDKAKISATLRQKISQDQLPPWFGGPGDYKPNRII